MTDKQRGFSYYAGHMYMVSTAVVASVLLFAAVFFGKTNTHQMTFYYLLSVIRQVESAGDDRAVGDNGTSRGPFQIKRAYWREAVVGTDAAKWDYDVWVWDPDRAGYVVYLRWCKICPEALRTSNLELLARCHRLPNDPWRKDNDDYWQRIKTRIKNE